MKPDGVAKNGNKYWDIYRVPAAVLIERQNLNKAHYPNGINTSKPESDNQVKGIAGIKCFEKPGKLVLMYVIGNHTKQKYEYKWMATFLFKKKSVMLLLNNSPWDAKGKIFTNGTYKSTRWDEIIMKTIQSKNIKQVKGTTISVAKTRLAFDRRMSELILWKAKKEGLFTGKLNKNCARKTGLNLLRLSIGSEFLCNNIYYFIKSNNDIETIRFEQGDKENFAIFKLLRKHNSLEKICKKVFGKNAKYLRRAVQARLIYRIAEAKSIEKYIPVNNENLINFNAENPINITVRPGNYQTFTFLRTLGMFDLSVFTLGKFLKEYINLDKVQDIFLEIERTARTKTLVGRQDLLPAIGGLVFAKQKIDKFFKHIGESRTERVLKDIWDVASLEAGLVSHKFNYLRDTANQWNEKPDKILIPSDLRTLEALHDYVTIEYRKLSTDNFDLKFKDEVVAIDGIELEGGLKLIIPKTNIELILWGQKMSNCIGSYGRQVNNSDGRQWLLGVHKDGALKYNIEVYNKEIHQFYSYRNSPADLQDKVTVLKFLAEKELAKERDLISALSELRRALDAGDIQPPIRPVRINGVNVIN